MAAALRAVFRRTPPAARLELHHRALTATAASQPRPACGVGRRRGTGYQTFRSHSMRTPTDFSRCASACRSSGDDQRDRLARLRRRGRSGRRGARRLGRIGHLVVDDGVDAVDVEAARGDVGGDEHVVASAAKSFDGDAPLILRAIGVQRGALDAGGGELARQRARRRSSCARKRAPGRRAAAGARSASRACALVGTTSARCVIDLRRLAAMADLHVLRLAHDLQREPHHIVRHRRREEQRLARSAGSAEMMRRTSGQKPMSIMRSASSSTSSSTPLRSAFCCRM